MKVGIIGAGAAGLSAGYELAKRGVSVHIFERDGVLGGLAGSFLLDGGYVEKFYHFICLNDFTYRELLKELGLASRLRWKTTGMGQIYNGKLYSFGRPLDLFFFPHLSAADKFRFARTIMRIKRSPWDGWKKVENIPVNEWLRNTFGPSGFRILYEPLIRHKFGKYADNLSASWMWARIHRLGRSRTKIRQREKVGYVEGGSQIIMDALGEEIGKRGNLITLNSSVQSFYFEGNKVRGLVVDNQKHSFDAVISTVALPAFLRILPDSFQGGYWQNLRSIESIGVICVFLQLTKGLTNYFWTNINDPRISLAGIIEYTNLNPLPHLNGDKIVYLPQYIDSSDEKFRRPDSAIVAEYVSYLKLISPGFSESSVKKSLVFREKYAQPICETGFSSTIPDIRTPLQGLFLTDSSQLHPDDRTISNSIGLGQKAAAHCLAELGEPSEVPQRQDS